MEARDIVFLLAQEGVQIYLDDGRLKTLARRGALSPKLGSLIRDNKKAIVAYLSSGSGSLEQMSLRKTADLTKGRLSSAQKRLWLLHKINGGGIHYNVPAVFRLNGSVNVDALKAAIKKIVARHQVLRTVYASGDQDEPAARLLDVGPFEVSYRDMSSEPKSTIERCVREELEYSFDLENDFALKAALFKVADAEYLLSVAVHHIAADGWSIGVIMAEFRELYTTEAYGLRNSLLPLNLQYRDYAHWQYEWVQTSAFHAELEYWEKELSDLPLLHSLPLDHPRPLVQSHRGSIVATELPKAVASELRILCVEGGTTMFAGFHALLGVLLSRYSNETDIVIGTPVANRARPEWANLVGLFVNTVVLRLNLAGEPTFGDLLSQCGEVLRGALENQMVPFELLVHHLRPGRSLGHSPLFQVMLVFESEAEQQLDMRDFTLSPVQHEHSTSKFDLTLTVVEKRDGRLQLSWEYAHDLFHRSTIERMSQCFALLARQLLRFPDYPAKELPMVNLEAAMSVAAGWKFREVAVPVTTIHQLFEDQANRSPDAVAISTSKGEVSYQELNRLANRIADYLIELGVGGGLVGVCMGRQAELPAALLAVMKAGAAYVPLDPSYPANRIRDIAENASLNVILTSRTITERPEFAGVLHVFIEDLLEGQCQAQICSGPLDAHLPDGLAYVLYTSGSTGKPKGVEIQHRNTIALLHWAKEEYGRDPGAVLFSTSICFDLSVFELFYPLCFGGEVVLVQDILELKQSPHAQKVRIINTVPSAVNALIDNEAIPESVDIVNLAGEYLPQELVDRLYAVGIGKIYDLYGPTECTTYATCALRELHGVAHIGQPIANTRLYLVDECMNLVPQGVRGEILLGGAGVARGYHKMPEMTSDKFVQNPFTGQEEVLYRTGDIARLSADGYLEYVGRADKQVKVRGFRVELGEIESALRALPHVAEAAVVAKEGARGEKALFAYVVGSDLGDALDREAADFSRRLAECLPSYMIPTLIFIEEIPKTSNGKVDRLKLSAMEVRDEYVDYVAPVTPVQHSLCKLWVSVLGVPKVGIRDNFFRLGGSSLDATRIMAQINKLFDISLDVSAIFLNQTVSELEAAVSSARVARSTPEIVPSLLGNKRPLSYAQNRIWIADQLGGGNLYNITAALKLSGRLDVAALKRAISTVVLRHEILRTTYGLGPDGIPFQLINANSKIDLPIVDLTVAEGIGDVASHVERAAMRPFDLRTDLMLRVTLLRLKEFEHILVVSVHHIASDGGSMNILVRELRDLYDAYVNGQDNPLPPLALQYSDFAHWQTGSSAATNTEEAISFWKTQLADLPDVNYLPRDSADDEKTGAGKRHTCKLEQGTSSALKALCREQEATTFMGVYAAFAVFLYRCSGISDVIVGMPVSNRTRHKVKDLIGVFVNTVVLRTDLSGHPSFREILARSKETCSAAIAHQEVPFEYLVEVLNPDRQTQHVPFFEIMINQQESDESQVESANLVMSPVEVSTFTPKFDLVLNVVETERGITLNWEYNSLSFSKSTVETMASEFIELVEQLTSNPEIDVCHPSSFVDWCSQGAFAAPKTLKHSEGGYVHELFKRQALAQPDAEAVHQNGVSISYRELDEKAEQLAQSLKKNKLLSFPVVLNAGRSIEMVIGMLGVLKAGGAFVPVDPTYPKERIRYILEDISARVLLTTSEFVAKMRPDEGWPETVVALDKLSLSGTMADRNGGDEVPRSSDLAYIVYTSGSTGVPKGVMVNNESIAYHIRAVSDRYCVSRDDRILQFSNIGFDTCIEQVLVALVNGATVVLRPDDLWTATSLEQWLLEKGISIINFTPSYAVETLPTLFANEDFWRGGRLRLAIVGGEAFPRVLFESWRHSPAALHCRLMNAYGPTETCITSHLYEFNVTDASVINDLGRMVGEGLQVVVDSRNRLLPAEAVGELCIGGARLARGYWNNPKLTAERFPLVKIGGDQQVRVYRTGDLVRQTASGRLLYLGRRDNQVKVRGFRVELEEIERHLCAVADVETACVVQASHQQREPSLVAYVTRSERSQSADEEFIEHLRTALAAQLPRYMTPVFYIILPALPLTPNGKVDRVLLAARPVSTVIEDPGPTSPLEQRLVRIWAEALKIDQVEVGVDENFFDMGGHSLAAVRLKHLLEEAGMIIEFRDLLGNPTIRTMARSLTRYKSNKRQSPLIKLNAASTAQRLYLLHPLDGSVDPVYRGFAKGLEDTCSVYGVQAPFLLNEVPSFSSMTELADIYAGAILEQHEHQTLSIGAYSSGGMIAAAVVQNLIGRGCQVGYFGLYDCYNIVLDKSAFSGTYDYLLYLLALILDGNGEHLLPSAYRALNDEELFVAAAQVLSERLDRQAAWLISKTEIKKALEFNVRRLQLPYDVSLSGFAGVVDAYYSSVSQRAPAPNWERVFGHPVPGTKVPATHMDFLRDEGLEWILPRVRGHLRRPIAESMS